MSVLRSSSSFRNWITCATYAILHALQTEEIDLLEAENSTGVTFGIRSMGEAFHCTRLLTPFRTFWDGMLPAASIWGIRIHLFHFSDISSLTEFLHTPPEPALVLGPVSMAGLHYLPFSSQYRCSDHYVALRMTAPGQFLLTDSEGVTEMPVTAEYLAGMCKVSDIPESEQVFTIGAVRQIGPAKPRQDRLYYSAMLAGNNLQAAELNGHGSKAILCCLRTMKNNAIQKWNAPLLYDLSYYIQRKEMLLCMTNAIQTLDYTSVSPALKSHIRNQQALAARIRLILSQRKVEPDERVEAVSEYMKILADTEKILAEQWKEWVKLQ